MKECMCQNDGWKMPVARKRGVRKTLGMNIKKEKTDYRLLHDEVMMWWPRIVWLCGEFRNSLSPSLLLRGECNLDLGLLACGQMYVEADHTQVLVLDLEGLVLVLGSYDSLGVGLGAQFQI